LSSRADVLPGFGPNLPQADQPRAVPEPRDLEPETRLGLGVFVLALLVVCFAIIVLAWYDDVRGEIERERKERQKGSRAFARTTPINLHQHNLQTRPNRTSGISTSGNNAIRVPVVNTTVRLTYKMDDAVLRRVVRVKIADGRVPRTPLGRGLSG